MPWPGTPPHVTAASTARVGAPASVCIVEHQARRILLQPRRFIWIACFLGSQPNPKHVAWRDDIVAGSVCTNCYRNYLTSNHRVQHIKCRALAEEPKHARE
jgi:hypothetical protein